MARKTRSKRRRKRRRRKRNRQREATWWSKWKAHSRPFRRRHLVGLRIGRNITVRFDFDYSTPISMDALDQSRPAESLEEIYDAIREAERVADPRGKA